MDDLDREAIEFFKTGTVTPTGKVPLAAGQSRPFVSEDGYDLCVVCRAETEFKTEIHIDRRQCYVEGVGQLCTRCWMTKDGAC